MSKILLILVLIGLVMMPMVAVADPAPPPPAADQGCDQVAPLLSDGVGDGTIPQAGTDAIINFGVCRGK